MVKIKSRNGIIRDAELDKTFKLYRDNADFMWFIDDKGYAQRIEPNGLEGRVVDADD